MNNKGPVRETMEQAGFRYCGFDRDSGCHILEDIETSKRELWFANKGHASYGITWRNTHLEFARDAAV